MSVNALLEEFKVKAATPKQQLAEYKAQGKKVVGVLPYYAPEELVYAAGIVPMGMWGSNTKTISRAKEYCATFYCTIAQLALEMLLDGTMDQLDGIITPTICDTLRPMSQNFRVAMGDKMKVIFLAHPQNRFEEFGLQFCIDQYNHVKADLEENEKKVILMRHDMRHFLNDTLNDLENNQNEHAIEYIHTLFDAIDQTVRKKYCLNDTVNMIMTSYENRMKDENIDFHYHLDIPQQLSISDIDLTSILSNGLENAFKAVMLLENERFIELNMQEKCGKLLISIENNYLNEPIFIDGIPISKEKDHGFGTQSIAYTVEKLHGNCQFSTHQHHFKLRVVI